MKTEKIVKNYQENCTDPKTQRMMFIYMTNHITTENCVAAKKNNGCFVDLEPSAGLDVAMIEFQMSVLDPTKQDVVISNMISHSQVDRDKKKEVKRMQDFVTGYVNSYSRILNGEKSLKNPNTTMICMLVLQF